MLGEGLDVGEVHGYCDDRYGHTHADEASDGDHSAALDQRDSQHHQS